MGLLTKLKSLLGLDDDRSQVRRGESGVTIEREPGESAEPNAETESAVKGVDAGAEESIDAGEPAETETAEPTGETESTEADASATESDGSSAETGISTEDATEVTDEVDEAAEPAEATEPSADAAEPDQTAADEPEPTPEETEESGADEPEVTDEPVGDGEPLENVKGIGAAYAERLNDAGVANVAELAKADAELLAEETGLSEKRISRWIDRAQSR